MNPTISGPSVRAAREAAKLSQSTVAQALGMNRMYYSLFEAGRYVLDATEQKALRDVFEAKGIELEDGDDRATTRSSQSIPKDVVRDESDDAEAPRVDYDPRVNPITNVLSTVSETAEETGVDSKRTAAAVAAASSALQSLDFPELLALAGLMDATIEGLPAPADFALLPVEDKQLWESRAVGMLICAALYDEAWTQTSCDEFRLIREALRKRTRNGDWNVRECGFFESDDKYIPHLRCQLAPYIAAAATERRAPTLA